jgi:hypothetical protein
MIFEKDKGLFAKWRRPRVFDRGGAGSQPFSSRDGRLVRR